MSQQTLDLSGSLRIVRRYLMAVVISAAVGLLAAVGYALAMPRILSAEALVVVSTASTNATLTQIVIASSNDVLALALPDVDPHSSLLALRSRITVKTVAPGVLSITAIGKTARQAERTANAVAESYVAYLSSRDNASDVSGRLLQTALTASGPSRTLRAIAAALVGMLAGALIGAIGALLAGRRDRRLRLRDEIADAIGLPVLASLPVLRPADAIKWNKLLEDYQPSAVSAWQLRSALRSLGLPDVVSGRAGPGELRSLSVISLSSDRRALALGPQLAAFAASQRVPTSLVIGPQRDTRSTATLRAACAALPQLRRSGNLRVSVAAGSEMERWPDATLTIVVTVVDDLSPRLDNATRTGATVLGVSPGLATADLLARIAIDAASNGCQISGILVADPDPADPTTGRLPQLARPTHRTKPTRVYRIAAARQRAGETKP